MGKKIVGFVLLGLGLPLVLSAIVGLFTGTAYGSIVTGPLGIGFMVLGKRMYTGRAATASPPNEKQDGSTGLA